MSLERTGDNVLFHISLHFIHITESCPAKLIVSRFETHYGNARGTYKYTFILDSLVFNVDVDTNVNKRCVTKKHDVTFKLKM